MLLLVAWRRRIRSKRKVKATKKLLCFHIQFTQLNLKEKRIFFFDH